jgi:hypothetical protein
MNDESSLIILMVLLGYVALFGLLTIIPVLIFVNLLSAR